MKLKISSKIKRVAVQKISRMPVLRQQQHLVMVKRQQTSLSTRQIRLELQQAGKRAKAPEK